MPKEIRVLPRELAEKIAAGEVVERPSSVVKELVENSIDAGAKIIRVELEDGGRKKLSVLDDGHGIPAEQVLIALERHATSKITELDDLWNLHTMGFRGEALPSIAAVSRFTLETSTGQDNRRIYLEGGKLQKDGPMSAQSPIRLHGTLIAVEDLFFNVPARLKFLKSKSAESATIRELLERIALCNPKVGFTLTSEGRKSLSVAPVSDQAVRVAQILEVKPENIESFESEFENITVRGWLDRDGRAPNSRHVYLSVNGRMVRDKLLQQAVLVALRPRMMEGEYPKVYLSVEVPPGEVDVNVHPAKSEVRFQKARDVFQVVHGALDRLAKTPTKAFYSTKLPESETRLTTTPRVSSASREEHPDPLPPPAMLAEQPRLFTANSSAERVVYKTKEALTAAEPALEIARKTLTAEPAPAPPKGAGFTTLHYIGQLKNTYLLFQDDEGLVVIDQHAAHERVNYERIKAEFLSSGLNPQPLLMSSVVKCSAEDVALALDNEQAFARLGFEFESFGDNALVVRSIPSGISQDRAADLFKAVLEELRDIETSEIASSSSIDPSRLSAKLERLLATSACHGSVRAGQALAPNEARELASQMEDTESSLNCPHGRPASIRLTFGQIEGLFKRG